MNSTAEPIGTIADGRLPGGGAGAFPAIGHPWQVTRTVTAADCPAFVFDDSLALPAAVYDDCLAFHRATEEIARKAARRPGKGQGATDEAEADEATGKPTGKTTRTISKPSPPRARREATLLPGD